MNKHVLIIGGCGYVGSLLTTKLKEDYYVDTVDLEWYGDKTHKNNFLVDFHNLNEDFYRKYQVIILLAGHSSVKMCLDNRASMFNNNVRNFVDLLDKLTDDQTFIYASSSSVYNENKTFTNNYDVSKSQIDEYAKLSAKKYFGLRFGTVSGCSPNFRIDSMINRMVYDALIKKKVTCFNPDIKRPILNIVDLCAGIRKIIQLGVFGNRGIYNMSSFNTTPRDVAKHVSNYLSVDLDVHEGWSDDVYDFQMDSTRFSEVFDFTFSDDIFAITDSIVTNLDKVCYVGVRNAFRLYQ